MNTANLIGYFRVVDALPHPVIVRAIPSELYTIKLDVVGTAVAFRDPFPSIAGNHPAQIMLFTIAFKGLDELGQIVVEHEIVTLEISHTVTGTVQNMLDECEILPPAFTRI